MTARRIITSMLALFMVCCAGHQVLAQPDESSRDADEKIMQGLRLTPRAFRIAAQRVESTLVAIESFGGTSTAAGKIGGIRQQGEGNTTGIMISPDGYVITSAFNFIEQPPVITVITSDGVRRVAKLLGRDDTRRICLLKIEDVEDMPVPEMISPDEIRVGQWAVSVGVGYGDSNPAISMGIISAKNRIGGRAIQTDANISPANYGGPLLDIEGRMIGICVPMSADSQNLASGVEWYDSGIGFAIPLVGLEGLIERLKDGRHIKRAFLGIQSEDIEDTDGVKITEVVPDTAAAEAELKTDDVIIKIDEHPTPNVAELRSVLAKYYAGDDVQLTFIRDDDEDTMTVTLGSPTQQEAEDTPSLFPGRRRVPQPGR
ncbi:MAG: S1C family serine protease [Pirellulaceae bacterium]